MLDVIETLIAQVLRAALPVGTEVNTGPPAPTAPTDVVTVEAPRLLLQPSPSADATRDRREPARPLRRYDLGPHPGTEVALGLPQVAIGEVAEVQCPPGRRLSTDAYVVDGRSLHLLSEGDGRVIVMLCDEAAGGYREVQRCRMLLSLVVTSSEKQRASALLATSLAAVLTAFADIDVVDLHRRDDGRFALRLIHPVAQLQSFVQAREEIGGISRYRRQAELLLRADLELLVATAKAPEPGGFIRRIDLDTLDVGGAE